MTDKTLQERMEALVRAMAAKANSDDGRGTYMQMTNLADYAEARAIVAELPKPVDPDVLAVREILASAYEAMGQLNRAEIFSRGNGDFYNDFNAALAAYKRIRADRA